MTATLSTGHSYTHVFTNPVINPVPQGKKGKRNVYQRLAKIVFLQGEGMATRRLLQTGLIFSEETGSGIIYLWCNSLCLLLLAIC